MRKQKLWASDIVFAEDNIFFSSGQFNGLFKAGLQGGEAEFINFFPYDSKLQSRLHGDAFKYNDEILFLPDLSEYITLYSIKNNNFVCMKFPVENKNPAMKYWPQVVGGIMIDSRVYAFGAKYPCVVCYDFETRKLVPPIILKDSLLILEQNSSKCANIVGRCLSFQGTFI